MSDGFPAVPGTYDIVQTVADRSGYKRNLYDFMAIQFTETLFWLNLVSFSFISFNFQSTCRLICPHVHLSVHINKWLSSRLKL